MCSCGVQHGTTMTVGALHRARATFVEKLLKEIYMVVYGCLVKKLTYNQWKNVMIPLGLKDKRVYDVFSFWLRTLTNHTIT